MLFYLTNSPVFPDFKNTKMPWSYRRNTRIFKCLHCSSALGCPHPSFNFHKTWYVWYDTYELSEHISPSHIHAWNVFKLHSVMRRVTFRHKITPDTEISGATKVQLAQLVRQRVPAVALPQRTLKSGSLAAVTFAWPILEKQLHFCCTLVFFSWACILPSKIGEHVRRNSQMIGQNSARVRCTHEEEINDYSGSCITGPMIVRKTVRHVAIK